ncbi:hypothetical protein EJ06DRAFT_313334 [Trichodelitschia bisporula]|uniref:Uncharacterized protein n=1 Tax=Trichodelitschia bisporula TaxID=703511 RepID=A0A6G1I3L5_9PEZI|nr:hypothetical protein EJ06DRAFT_313334 [Trichodelitschia bisporula]
MAASPGTREGRSPGGFFAKVGVAARARDGERLHLCGRGGGEEGCWSWRTWILVCMLAAPRKSNDTGPPNTQTLRQLRFFYQHPLCGFIFRLLCSPLSESFSIRG